MRILALLFLELTEKCDPYTETENNIAKMQLMIVNKPNFLAQLIQILRHFITVCAAINGLPNFTELAKVLKTLQDAGNITGAGINLNIFKSLLNLQPNNIYLMESLHPGKF